MNAMSNSSNINNVTLTHYEICFHKGNPESACGMIPNYYRRKFGRILEINKALQDFNNSSSSIYDEEWVIIHISIYRISGINNLFKVF